MGPPPPGATTPDTSGTPWAVPGLEVVANEATDVVDGLTDVEVARRRGDDGPNELDARPPIPAWRRLLEQFRDPLVFLLLAAIVFSLAAWAIDDADEPPIEAGVIAVIVVANALIGFWQERRAIAAVAALQDLAATRTTVRRDGAVMSVPSRDLVRGDIVVFAEGDAVGADCRLVETAAFEVAEAALTGESEPVEKQTAQIDAEAPVADRRNMAFNGTAVVRGTATGVVVATGMRTEIGRIAALIESAEDEPTPLQRQIAWLGRRLGLVVVVLALVVVGTILLTSDISSAGDVVDALLVGVSLAVAAVPEGLPAILTIVLALGVQRMAQQRAIVKRLSSVETLGSASVICSDKTGTLTRNEMTLVRVVTATADVDITGTGYATAGGVRLHGDATDADRIDLAELSADAERLLVGGCLANNAAAWPAGDSAGGAAEQDVHGGVELEVLGDPTEIAFLVAARKLGAAGTDRFRRIAEIPFDSDRKLMSVVVRDVGAPDGSGAIVDVDPEQGAALVTKGAPDVLIHRCTHELVDGEIVPLDAGRRAEIAAVTDALADDALRTLAVGVRRLPPGEPGEPGGVGPGLEHDLVHLGVVGIIDPPRDEAASTVAEAQRAGIEVKMITGDHPRTAGRIAERLGLIGHGPGPSEMTSSEVVTGSQLAALEPADFDERVRSTAVFARVSPEQKLRLVDAMQRDGHVVAMTGDGVNDAPALRQADIGVAMGINGTEVSKEAADMILADDDVATILRAVREGRDIFSDIRKFLRFLLASNAGEVLTVFVGVLVAGAIGLADDVEGLAVPLLATQILWINLVTDSSLALALGVDPAVEDVMAQPPRRLEERVVDRAMAITIGVVGVVTALASLAALDLGLDGGLLGGSGDLTHGRTMAFTTLVFAQVVNAFNARSDHLSVLVQPFGNRLLWAAAALTVSLQVLVVHAPPLQRSFSTSSLSAAEWTMCWALAGSVLVAEEVRKTLRRRTLPSLPSG